MFSIFQSQSVDAQGGFGFCRERRAAGIDDRGDYLLPGVRHWDSPPYRSDPLPSGS